MGLLIIILLVAGSAALLFFLCNIIRAFGLIICAILASIAAFAWFELLADTFIAKGTFAASAHSSAFLLLFIFTFIILAAFNFALTRSDAQFNPIIERTGRIFCGLILGFILSGVVLTGMIMAPMSEKNPYPRFSSSGANLQKPAKSLLVSDDFITNFFNFLSCGSFSGKNNFEAIHPNFLNQVFLNRINKNVPLATSSNAMEIPAKTAVWPAHEKLKDTDGKDLPSENGCKPMIARIGIKKNAKNAGTFSISQISIVCSDKPLKANGKKINKYPIGYLTTPENVKLLKFTDVIKLEPDDFITPTRWIDFLINIPENLTPVMAQFKQNNIAQLPEPVSSDKAPLPEPFIPQSKCTTGSIQLPKAQSVLYGVELQTNEKFLDGFSLQVKDVNEWQKLQSNDSIKPAVFETNYILMARAELVKTEPNKNEDVPEYKAPVKTKKKKMAKKFTPGGSRAGSAAKVLSFTDMLKPASGYKLISMKCNNPAAGKTIKGEELPILHELSGLEHYPVGVISSAKTDNQTIYEIDYCSLPADSENGCLTCGKNGNVEKPFPDEVWITEKSDTNEFYLLYMLKNGTLITSIKNADGSMTKFEKFDGFLIK